MENKLLQGRTAVHGAMEPDSGVKLLALLLLGWAGPTGTPTLLLPRESCCTRCL